MSNVFDVPAGDLIEEIAKELKKKPNIQEPVFANWAKTGSHRERAPQNKDWWFMRLASILYQSYKNGSVGTGRLRSYYGGRKSRGVRPHVFRKSGGKIIRLGLQMLEKEGFLKKIKKGRIVTKEGEKFLALKAKETLAGLEEKRRAAKERAKQREQLRREKESKQEKAPIEEHKKGERGKEPRDKEGTKKKK